MSRYFEIFGRPWPPVPHGYLYGDTLGRRSTDKHRVVCQSTIVLDDVRSYKNAFFAAIARESEVFFLEAQTRVVPLIGVPRAFTVGPKFSPCHHEGLL